LRAEGFSCNLGVLYRGLGISKLQFFYQKKKKNFLLKFLKKILVIKILDPELDPNPDPQLEKMLDPDPH
jgi:hypothetical protein